MDDPMMNLQNGNRTDHLLRCRDLLAQLRTLTQQFHSTTDAILHTLSSVLDEIQSERTALTEERRRLAEQTGRVNLIGGGNGGVGNRGQKSGNGASNEETSGENGQSGTDGVQAPPIMRRSSSNTTTEESNLPTSDEAANEEIQPTRENSTDPMTQRISTGSTGGVGANSLHPVENMPVQTIVNPLYAHQQPPTRMMTEMHPNSDPNFERRAGGGSDWEGQISPGMVNQLQLGGTGRNHLIRSQSHGNLPAPYAPPSSHHHRRRYRSANNFVVRSTMGGYNNEYQYTYSGRGKEDVVMEQMPDMDMGEPIADGVGGYGVMGGGVGGRYSVTIAPREVQMPPVVPPPARLLQLRPLGRSEHGQPVPYRYPLSVAWTSGQFLVADFGNDRIRIIDSAGVLVRALHVMRPRAVCADIQGRIYVASEDNSIRALWLSPHASGLVRQWGSLGTNPGEFHDPSGIAVDKDGQLYIADTENNRVQIFTTDGTHIRTLDLPGKPFGVAITPAADFLFVSLTSNDVIMKISTQTWENVAVFGVPEPIPAGEAPIGQLSIPMGITLDASGRLWVADCGNGRVVGFSADGGVCGSIGKGEGGLLGPAGVCLDENGKVYATDYRLHGFFEVLGSPS